jgi:AcrR family transcriptional regulator
MPRKYELKRRADRLEETRRRIVEAAIQLHATKGPALTSLSDVARLAGVQRNTLYRHFPGERELGLACSGLHMERNPPPDPTSWHEIHDRDERLRRGLADLYRWFDENDGMLSCVLRDAEFHALTREMFELRAGETIGAIRAALAEVVPGSRAAQATLDLALDFRAWKRLRASELTNDEAVEAMVRAVACQ